jgi:hypothetical protein
MHHAISQAKEVLDRMNRLLDKIGQPGTMDPADSKELRELYYGDLMYPVVWLLHAADASQKRAAEVSAEAGAEAGQEAS